MEGVEAMIVTIIKLKAGGLKGQGKVRQHFLEEESTEIQNSRLTSSTSSFREGMVSYT